MQSRPVDDTEPLRPTDKTALALSPSSSAEDSRIATGHGSAVSSPLSGGLGQPQGAFEKPHLLAAGITLSTDQLPQPHESVSLLPATTQPETGARQDQHHDQRASQTSKRPSGEPPAAASFPNGYHFPPRHSLAESMKLACMAFWDYVRTPVGVLVTIYGLNVVAWGGMLFLLLCNASPAMCFPTCNDIDSPRRKWIEIDSQILNALFCLTGFGLAPWRFRDLYLMLQYRVMKRPQGIRKLAGIHRGWFRLAGSNELPAHLGPRNIGDERSQAFPLLATPYPPKTIPDAPLTGTRARPTKVWKLDLVIWLMVWNTLFQCCLSGFMWGMSRYDRPGWATGLFVGLACGVAAIAGLVMLLEAKTIKNVEGVPVSQWDLERLERDRQLSIWHYNNKGQGLEKWLRRPRRERAMRITC